MQFDAPLVIGGKAYPYAVLSARHQGYSLDNLNAEGNLGCNEILVPAEGVSADSPLDISWKREVPGDVTTLELTDPSRRDSKG